MLIIPQCVRCVHFAAKGKGMRCRAFPGGIPRDILMRKVLHDTPYPGDNGILFEEDLHWAGDGDDDFTPTGPAFE
ncbi:MAG: hypothetical protein EOM03_18400 [Clostridia bacterium]|nr:hypothetical protein [Clostridia bacterium]